MTGQKLSYKNRLAEAFKQFREAGRRKTKPFPLENDSEKILDQSQSAVAGDLTKHKIGLGKPRTITLSRI